MSETRLAKIISIILNPYYILPAGILALSIGMGPSILVDAVIFIVVGLVPLLVGHIILYLRDGRSGLGLPREKRTPLYLLAVLTFSLDTILFGSAMRNDEFWFLLAMVMAIWFGLHYLVNKFYDKTSFHVSVFVLVTMLFLDQVSPRLGVLFLLLPLLIWSRVVLHKHTRQEILFGMTLGLVGGLLMWFV